MFISLIIPCYNCERYLTDCLDSLLNQNFQEVDYEIICVNDGSTDSTPQILASYADSYRNIFVITQENKGVSEARNAGLYAAKGDYIWFIDSDDLISRDAIKKIYNKYTTGNLEWISFEIFCFIDGILLDLSKEYKSNANYYDSTVVTSVFKRSFLLNNELSFRYPKIFYGEDSLFMLELKLCKPNRAILNNVLYFYRNHPGSAMTTQTKESNDKRIASFVYSAVVLNSYNQRNLEPRIDIVNLLMSSIWHAVYTSCREGLVSFYDTLKVLRAKKLFPFNKPSECTLVKSYETTRSNFTGRIFDKLFVNSNRYWGAIGLYIMVSIIKFKHYMQQKFTINKI